MIYTSYMVNTDLFKLTILYERRVNSVPNLNIKKGLYKKAIKEVGLSEKFRHN